MHQFFVEPSQIHDTQIIITGADVNHIKNVLRMKPEEEFSVSAGTDGREYRCRIKKLEEQAVICEILFIRESGIELPSKVYLFQSLPKGDKMELIIQKAVELGVYEIIPVAAKRCVVRLDEKKAKNKIARWQSISEAAAKQSKRLIIPEVKPVMTFEEAVGYSGGIIKKIIPYELAKGMEDTKEVIGSLKPDESVAVFVGPEGGFEPEEVKKAFEASVVPVTMGKRILRTETAAITILGWIMYQLEP